MNLQAGVGLAVNRMPDAAVGRAKDPMPAANAPSTRCAGNPGLVAGGLGCAILVPSIDGIRWCPRSLPKF